MGKSFRPASGEILCKGNKGSGRIFFDETIYEVDFSQNPEQKTLSVVSKEKPVRGRIELYKTDKETGGSSSQVQGTSFAGAVYEVLAEENIGALKKERKQEKLSPTKKAMENLKIFSWEVIG